MQIVKSKIPDVDDGLNRKVVNLVQRIRNLNLNKKPSVRASVDWVNSVKKLNKKDLDESLIDSMGVVVKNESDKKRVLKDIFKQ